MKWSYRWALFFLLASFATAAGTVEPAPAWHTGPVDFKKAKRVPAFYCNARSMAPGPEALTGHEQIPSPGLHRAGPALVPRDSRSAAEIIFRRFLVPVCVLRTPALKTTAYALTGARVKNRPRGSGFRARLVPTPVELPCTVRTSPHEEETA